MCLPPRAVKQEFSNPDPKRIKYPKFRYSKIAFDIDIVRMELESP